MLSNETTMKGTTNEWTGQNLSDHHRLGDHSGLGDFSAQGASGGDFFSDLDTSIYYDAEDDCNVGLGLLEGDFQSPFDVPTSFGSTALDHLSHFKKRGRSKALAQSQRVDIDDFENQTQQNAFLLVMQQATHLLNPKSSPKKFREGLEFFFFGVDRPDQIDFDLCATVLNVRADVIRLRIQYEWWLRGNVFSGPFDFASVPSPAILEGEIRYYAGSLGHALTREIWVQPGINTQELFDYVGPRSNATIAQMTEAMNALSDSHIVSKNNGWYLTGRNPMLSNMGTQLHHPSNLITGGSVHWTRLFGTAPD